ncbi:beta strand repeat-containing protein [Rubrivivax rivuli]|uniref:beta strand repeat-containing protein n=1 Tax=Rubrivivax rivuli TaxID=1862385 RepID=UPI00196B8F3D|nr:autotransporter-associated beta strand repeat-containing protein [Rubrivivax rivuli]
MLPDAGTVSVVNGATLSLGGNDSVATLTLGGTLAGASTLTADTTLASGALVQANLGGSNLTVSGNATLQGTAAATTVQIDGGTLTLASASRLASTASVTVAGPATLALGGNQTLAAVLGTGTVNLASHTLTLASSANLVYAGSLTGTGGLVKTGTGSYTLTGAQAYGGSTLVAQGNLVLQGDNRLPDGSAVTVASGATLTLGGADTVGSLALSGTLAGTGALTAASYALAAGSATLAGADLGAGVLNVAGNSSLGGAAGAGTVNVNGGILSLGSADRLADNAAVSVASGATLALAGNDTVATLALAGTLAGSTQTLTATTTTLQTGASVDANLAGTTLRVTGNATLSGTAANAVVNVEGGVFTLAVAERLADTAALTVAGGSSLLLGGTETVGTLTLAGTLGSAGRTLAATTYTLQAGATALANLGAGTLTSTGNATLAGTSAADTVNVNGGTLTLGAANRLSDNAAVTVVGGATLRLNGDDTVRLLALSGTLDGTGTLSAGTYTLTGGTYDTPLGAGDLTVSGNSTLNATSAAATVTINTGTLTLGAPSRFSASPALTINTGAGLTLAGAETFGSVAGSGNVALGGATLTHAGLADSVFGGAFSGSGGVVKAGNSSFTLNGAQAYTGTTRVEGGTLRVGGTLASAMVQVAGGTLVLDGANRLADTATLNVASGARLTLAGDDTVASLALAGTLEGSGTLTAATVDLNGGRVDANLGAGTLRSTGSSQLNGSSAATSLAVDGGTLSLSAANRLTASPVTTLAGGATLVLQGDHTLGALAGTGNVTLGSFVLTTGGAGDSTYSGTLSGSGGLVKQGNGNFTLGGSQLYTGATRVLAGRLLTAAADVLPDGSALDVASGATLTLGGNDSVASLTLAGTLGGSGTLSASTYALSGATVGAALGAGALTSSGNTQLNANSAATTVQVTGGTLTLGGANRLADGAALTVAAGATLALGGSDTVGSLALAGTLAGNGTLTATTYTLAGASVNANLGAGTLLSSGSSTLTGTAAALQVQVLGGTLTLAAADRLADAAQLSVASGATLSLTGDDTVAALALAGTLQGAGTLTAASYALDGATVAANLGAGVLGSTGLSTLSGRSAAGSLLVNGGTLTLASAGRLSATPATSVAAGASLRLGGDETLGTLAGAGAVDLASFTLNTGSGGDSRYDGTLTGTGGLVKTGPGSFTLGGANTYTGSTQVLAGTLGTAAADVLPDASALTVASGATLAPGGNDRVASLVLAGTLQGSATLTAATYTLASGTVVADLGTGRLVSTGSSRLQGASAATDVAVDSGTLTLGAADRLANGAAVAVASGATLQMAGDDTIGQLSLAGTLAGSGRLTATSAALQGGRADAALAVGSFSSTGSSTLNGTLLANSVLLDSGTLSLGSAQRLAGPAAVTLNPGTSLRLAGDETLGTLAGGGDIALGSATLRTGSGGSSSYAGVLSGTGALVKQGGGSFTLGAAQGYTGRTTVEGGTLTVQGSLASAALQVDAGTLVLTAADRLADTATVAVASGATLTLNGNDAVASLTLAGTLGGSGTFTAATVALDGGTASAALGAGTLRSTGNSRLESTTAASTVQVDSGTLTLAAADRLVALPAVTVATGATLALGGDQRLGTLAGAGRVALASHTLRSGLGGDSRFDGQLEGTGDLVKQGPSVFTLGGSNSHSGSTRVEAGTLALAAAERLADNSAVRVDRFAILQLNGDETVASLTLAGGTVGGTGQLTATRYALEGGTVNTPLGAGSLSSRGDSVLNSISAASLVEVLDGTLTLAGAERLPALPAVNLSAGASLAFGGDQGLGTLTGGGNVALGSFTLRTGSGGDSSYAGTLSGTGGLVKTGSSSFTLAGNQAYTGSTRVQAGTLVAAGTLASSALQVDAGTLVLGSADRLADTATVAVARGATLTLAGNDTAASLTLAGTLNGSGVLSGASYTLDGATVVADLGTGTLRSTGNTRLDGRAGAGSLFIDGGSFTLGSADRLSDSAALGVASGATLVLAATDTIGSLALAGTYTGGGTLTAATYLVDGGRAEANFGAGSLVARGNSTLAGTAAVSSVLVESGTLALAAAQRLPALPAVQVAAGGALAFAGDQNLGSLAGAGNLSLGSFTLSTGTGGDSSFAGVISGSGGLVKQGSSSVFTLTGTNTYTGLTRVAAGTLRVGDGGSTGSLATSAFELTGLLSLARSDTHTLAQPISGSGAVEQAGTGRLLFSGNNKSYTGATTVTRGELATASADELPDGSDLRVLAAGRLALGGREAVRTVEADGSVALGSELVTTGDLLLRGAVSAPAALRLSGQRIEAPNAGNRFGGTVSIDARGALTLSSGTEGNVPRSLVLGTVNAADGGRIDSGALSLTGVTTVSGGTLSLVAAAPLAVLAPGEELANRQATSLPIAFAADAVSAETGSRISVASGASLRVLAPNGGSVQLLQAANSFLGELSVLSGALNSPWSANSTALSFNGVTANYAVQSRVRIEGGTVNIGGDGVLADVVSLRADRLSTVGNAATIVARLPFDSTAGTVTSLPALTLELTPAAFELSFPFGAPGNEGGLRVDVGSRAYGNRTLPLDAGFVTVLPRNGARGATAVLLRGPVVNPSGGYRFFFDGAGNQAQIPVFYNGVLPTTPQVENSISATVAVSEGARKAGFDDAVRTENVAVRLRAGVIAEVGPAPAATQGTEGLRVPSGCAPAAGALLCGPAN